MKKNTVKRRPMRWKKPPRFLYFIGILYARLMIQLKYRVKIDRTGLKDMRGPCLVLSPHLSDQDHWLVGLAMLPHRPTFVLSAHFMANPKLRPVLRMMHCISKKMFCPDLSTILNIMRAREAGCSIVLFPEGRLPCVPVTDPVTEGTAQLIRKLCVPVYVVHAAGAALTFPKWAEHPRRGEIHISGAKLFDAKQLADMTDAEIESAVGAALCHDELALCKDIAFHAKACAKGAENILYRCPHCNEEYTIQTEDDRIFCSACGFSASIDAKGYLDGAHFNNIIDWYAWQGEQLAAQHPVLQAHMTLDAVGDDGNMQSGIGKGEARMDETTFSFAGEAFGNPFSFSLPLAKVGTFPLTTGKWFDCYVEKRQYRFLPPRGAEVAKWAQYADVLRAERLCADGKTV